MNEKSRRLNIPSRPIQLHGSVKIILPRRQTIPPRKRIKRCYEIGWRENGTSPQRDEKSVKNASFFPANLRGLLWNFVTSPSDGGVRLRNFGSVGVPRDAPRYFSGGAELERLIRKYTWKSQVCPVPDLDETLTNERRAAGRRRQGAGTGLNSEPIPGRHR